MTPAERKADRILATKPWVNLPKEQWVVDNIKILSGGLAHIGWRDKGYEEVLLCGRREPAWKCRTAAPECRRCAVCDAVWKMILAVDALERSVS